MVNCFLDVFRKYAQFEGRTSRRTYWMFFLANFIVALILGILSMIPYVGVLFTIISWVYSVALIVPGLAVCIRRLHDIDKPWPWIFISFIPIVGFIWYIVLLAKDGDAGDNQFGPKPEEIN